MYTMDTGIIGINKHHSHLARDLCNWYWLPSQMQAFTLPAQPGPITLESAQIMEKSKARSVDMLTR